MPIPSNPSILSLIQEGMKKALGRTATSGEQARALDEWTEEIKNEIWMESPTHELLENDTIFLQQAASKTIVLRQIYLILKLSIVWFYLMVMLEILLRQAEIIP